MIEQLEDQTGEPVRLDQAAIQEGYLRAIRGGNSEELERLYHLVRETVPSPETTRKGFKFIQEREALEPAIKELPKTMDPNDYPAGDITRYQEFSARVVACKAVLEEMSGERYDRNASYGIAEVATNIESLIFPDHTELRILFGLMTYLNTENGFAHTLGVEEKLSRVEAFELDGVSDYTERDIDFLRNAIMFLESPANQYRLCFPDIITASIYTQGFIERARKIIAEASKRGLGQN